MTFRNISYSPTQIEIALKNNFYLVFFFLILFTFQCTECCVLDVSTSIYKLRVHMARIILKSIFYTMLSSRFKTFSLQNRLMCLRKKLWPTSITALVCSIYANICGHIEYRIVWWGSTQNVWHLSKGHVICTFPLERKKFGPHPRRNDVTRFIFLTTCQFNGAPSIQIDM